MLFLDLYQLPQNQSTLEIVPLNWELQDKRVLEQPGYHFLYGF